MRAILEGEKKMSERGWRATWQAWIDGVKHYFPGEPKASYQ